jgi:hypothetical protein
MRRLVRPKSPEPDGRVLSAVAPTVDMTARTREEAEASLDRLWAKIGDDRARGDSTVRELAANEPLLGATGWALPGHLREGAPG